MQRRQWLTRFACAVLPLTWAHPASAQAWPARPIRLVVPFPPGGLIDNMARLIGPRLSQELGQPVVIDNKPGAGGNLGASDASRAAADGYTLLMASPPLTINPALYKKLPYQPEQIAPLGLLGRVPNVLMVNPNSGIQSVAELSARIKARPGQLNYASNGQGTSLHLSAELYKSKGGLFITHIPYRGAGPALQDLIAGNVDVMFDGLGSSAAHIKGGRIKALMVSGSKRNAAFPDVPCSAELGLPDYTVSTWYGVWAPKGTPADAQARAIEEIRRSCQTDEAKAVWANQGAEFPNLTTTQFEAFIKKELNKWAQVVKASGAKLD